MTAVDHAPGPPGTSEDRVHQRSVLAQVLSKTEVGALIGAIAVFILFFCAASSFRSLETTGNILYQALTDDPEEQKRRMRALRRQVLTHDVDRWARSFLSALGVGAPNDEPDDAASG